MNELDTHDNASLSPEPGLPRPELPRLGLLEEEIPRLQ